MWPDPRLRQRAEPVDEITDEIRTLWDDMLETMYAMPGIGLAAPQIGVMRRVAVVDVGDGAHTALRMANPEIITASPDFGDWDEGQPKLAGRFSKHLPPTRGQHPLHGRSRASGSRRS